ADIAKISRKRLERITKKRTKNEAKTTKPDSEWKSRKKTKSKSKPKPEKVNRKSTQVNPEAKSQENYTRYLLSYIGKIGVGMLGVEWGDGVRDD
ncbi:hypothetical protein Tco_0724042, partial [Tanacetum coccineum]